MMDCLQVRQKPLALGIKSTNQAVGVHHSTDLAIQHRRRSMTRIELVVFGGIYAIPIRESGFALLLGRKASDTKRTEYSHTYPICVRMNCCPHQRTPGLKSGRVPHLAGCANQCARACGRPLPCYAACCFHPHLHPCRRQNAHVRNCSYSSSRA